MLAVATIAMIAATTSYLRFVHGWDWASAFLGASPGAMAQVVALSAEFKADLRGVAIVQVMRVLLIMIGLPGSLALFGLCGRRGDRRAGTRGRLLAGRACGPGRRVDGAGAVPALDQIPRRAAVRRDGGSAILHGTGWVHAILPWWLGGGAVIVIGAVAGSRFSNTSWRTVVDYLGAALGSFAVAIATAACFATLVMLLLPFRPADVIIAFAPGAQDQMMLLALALTLDPVYVGAHHLSRWLICTFSLAIFAKSLTFGKGKPPEQKPWTRPGQGMTDD